MSRTNTQISNALQDAHEKLGEVIEALDDNDDVEYENLETLTQPAIEAIDKLAEAVASDDDDEG